MNKNIPNQVQHIADQEGCNSIEYVGKYKNDEVYSLGEVDENGIPVPTGLPLLVLWNGERAETVSGQKSLDILSRF